MMPISGCFEMDQKLGTDGQKVIIAGDEKWHYF